MNKKKALILYGLPCSGKSSAVKSMSDFHAIAVDNIIQEFVVSPSTTDFSLYSVDVVKNIVSEIRNENFDKYIIEMGCLMPKAAIDLLECSLNELGFSFVNIKLSADDDELVKRITKRNQNIEQGKSNGIKVDGPDYLTRFKLFFNDNQATEQVDIDTTNKTIENIILTIKR